MRVEVMCCDCNKIFEVERINMKFQDCCVCGSSDLLMIKEVSLKSNKSIIRRPGSYSTEVVEKQNYTIDKNCVGKKWL